MIGFVGTGNMGSAIIKGMLSSGIKSDSIFVNDRNSKALPALKEAGVNICSNNVEVAKNSKYIFLAVKPIVYDEILHEISSVIDDDNVIVTMAAGFDIARVKMIIGDKKIVRIMPNTPALVNSGFTVACYDDKLNTEERETVTKLLKTFGGVKEITENYINAYSALSGSSPAFIFMLIEAMADAAVLMGIPRSDAYEAAETTIIGSAKLALESHKHPGELKDMVCSPGGTTIEGVRTLEENGFRSSIIEALINTYKKNIDISKIR